MSRTKPYTRRPKDPRRMAVLAVQRWYDSLVESPDAHTQGHVDAVTLETDFDAVEEALVDEHERDYGPFKSDEDREDYHAILARTAGYLIGVQVGLRLRAAGGAR